MGGEAPEVEEFLVGMGFDPLGLTVEERKEQAAEMAAIRQEEFEAEQKRMEARRGWAKDYGETWKAAYDNVSAGATAANVSIGIFEKSVEASVKTAILGGKGLKKALVTIVRDEALAGAVRSTIISLVEFAKGVSWAAVPFGAGSAQAAIHFAASATAAVQAALLGGIAAAAHNFGGLCAKSKRGGSKRGISRGSAGGTTGGGASAGGVGGGGGEQKITIDMKVDLDGERIHQSMVEHEGKAGRDQRGTIKGAA
jgi:hypothetical protein